MYMSFTTPTVDVYVPGTTLGLGNVNASTINIGQAGTTINVGGAMAITNAVTAPSCTMSSLTTGSLIISPFSGNAAFTNFSAVNVNISNASMINASFNSINSSNILIGPYPISGTFTDLTVTNANVTTLNVSNFLLTPLPTYQSGFISNPVATTPTLQSFTTIRTVNPPLVFLTYDYGLGSTNIVNVGVVGIQGSANAWTGFYYLTSSSGTASSKLYWLVTN